MKEIKEKVKWKKLYSAVLIANVIYIVLFYIITNSYS